MSDSHNTVLIATQKQLEQYSILDVIFPVIGNQIDLDEESLAKKVYDKLLEEEEIKIQDFSNHNKSFMMNGDWRKIIEMPEELEWKLKHFS